jgi:putative ABC transport system permease protein
MLRSRFVEGLWHDVRQAVLLTLALGIGANTAIFTVVNAVLLRPLPYDRPEELVMMWELDRLGKSGDPGTEWTVAPANYLQWLERNSTLRDIAAFNYWHPTLSGVGQAERIMGSVVTPNIFNVLGVAPMLGSGFSPEHGIPGNNNVVILSHGFWQRRFGGDPSLVGRTITLSSVAYTVLGVMPADFRHPEPHVLGEAQVWRPIAWTEPESSFGRHLRTVARLRPGVAFETAVQDMAMVSRQLELDFPAADADWGVMVRPIREELYGEIRGPLLLLLGGAGFVLLIVCANVANLVLARSHGRRKEFAIRTSLGAGRRRLAGQLVAENVLLTLAGGGVGLLAVQAGTGFLRAVQDQYIPSVADIRVDATVVGFMMAIALVTGVLFGILPVLQASRTDLRTAITEESAGSGVTRGARRLRNGLVVVEVVLATVLAVGAGLMTRSFTTLINVPTGFETANRLSFGLRLPTEEYDPPERRRAFYTQLLPRLRSLPSVQQVAMVSDLPFTTENRFLWVKPGVGLPAAVDWILIEYRYVGPGYFDAMGIDLIAGRDFRDDDRGEGDFVPAIVNQRMVEQFWQGEDALGRQFPTREFESPMVVVGVVGDILDDSFDGEREPRFYLPIARRLPFGSTFIVASNSDPTLLVAGLRQEAEALEPEVLASGFRSLDDLVGESLADERVALTLASVFSVLALALAGVGIYGVMSYAVGERRREIGIRGALGAQRSDVMRLVIGHSGMLTVVGVVVGIAVALPLARILSTFLYGVRPSDPLTLGVTAAVLAAVALAASYLPAARATRISPVEALRSER